MGTCRSCISWKPYETSGFGTCDNPNWRKGYHIQYKDMKSNQLIVENDEGWGFMTGPDFGCVHHKSR